MLEEMSFGERLDQLMDTLDLKAKELAHESGVSHRHINALTSGERKDPSLSIATMLARALGVSLDWLAGLPKGNPGQLEPDEKHLLDLYRRLPPDGQRLMLGTMSLAAEIRMGNEEGTGGEGL